MADASRVPRSILALVITDLPFHLAVVGFFDSESHKTRQVLEFIVDFRFRNATCFSSRQTLLRVVSR